MSRNRRNSENLAKFRRFRISRKFHKTGFWGWGLAPRIPQAPPQRLFGEFQKFLTSSSFRDFLGLGPCAPERAAVSGIPGAGGSDVWGRDWRYNRPDLGGSQRESLGFLGAGPGSPGPRGPPAIFQEFPEFLKFPKLAKFRRISRFQTLRLETGGCFGGSGRRGVECVGSRLALQRARFGGLTA